MEIVNIESQTFEAMMNRFEAFTPKGEIIVIWRKKTILHKKMASVTEANLGQPLPPD